MLNEFAYCARLAYLEWVNQLWDDNEYTHDGRWVHRAADRETGALPPTTGDGSRAGTANAVTMSSERLGLIGRFDVVESADGTAVPVEVKRGRPAPTPSGVWPPEEIQVTALAMILRDNGLRCDRAEVYFEGVRRRVAVDVTDERVDEVMAAIEGLRATAASGRMPPPLEGSPKCNGCSLSGICMPDEINQLGFAKVKASRRLVPSESAAHPMYVTDPRCRVGREGGRVVVVRQGETLASERLIDVSQLCVFGNVQVSSQLVGELMSRGVPILWFSFGGWLRGITEGLPSKHVELRRRQVHAVDESSSMLGCRMIEGKIRNSRTLLRRNGRGVGAEVLESMRRLALKAGRAESVKVLLGYEGTAARLYFANFSKMLRGAKSLPGGSFDFTGRNRRPPRDAMNCLLSFSYALLTKDCLAALFSIGFDPYLGVLHRPRFGRPALALDLAEEFRPLIAESVALTLVNNGEIKESDFICRAGAVALTANGRRAALRVYERRLLSTVTHPTFGYQVTYRRAIEVQARVLAAVVLGELEAYQPMVTR